MVEFISRVLLWTMGLDDARILAAQNIIRLHLHVHGVWCLTDHTQYGMPSKLMQLALDELEDENEVESAWLYRKNTQESPLL